MVRGKHKNCDRAGQGWWRLIDPRPLVVGRDCNDPANDVTGDYSPAYAVPLGGGAQVVVMDLSHGGSKLLKRGDPRIGQFGQSWRDLVAFARGASFAFMTLERTGPISWTAEVHGLDGELLRRCAIRGRRSSCVAA